MLPMWKRENMQVWKYGNRCASRLVYNALTALGVCIFSCLLTCTIAYCGEARFEFDAQRPQNFHKNCPFLNSRNVYHNVRENATSTPAKMQVSSNIQFGVGRCTLATFIMTTSRLTKP